MKLKRWAFALACTLCLSITALAGTIPIGGYTEIPYSAGEGFFWSLINGLWYMLSIT